VYYNFSRTTIHSPEPVFCESNNARTAARLCKKYGQPADMFALLIWNTVG